MPQLQPRPVSDADASALVELVGAAFDEYPGCVLDLDDLDADLLAPAAAAASVGGRWWAVDASSGGLAATIAAGSPADGTVELKRLYVAAHARGAGLGASLVRWVERHAAGLGANRLELWSDTRFDDAHRLYQRLGFQPTGQTRELHDPSDTTERHFVQSLEPFTARDEASRPGPEGLDRRHRFVLPDGDRLLGVTEQGLRYEIEVDGSGRLRRIEAHRGTRTCVLTSDGEGRWWFDGVRRRDLDGHLTATIDAAPDAVSSISEPPDPTATSRVLLRSEPFEAVASAG